MSFPSLVHMVCPTLRVSSIYEIMVTFQDTFLSHFASRIIACIATIRIPGIGCRWGIAERQLEFPFWAGYFFSLFEVLLVAPSLRFAFSSR